MNKFILQALKYGVVGVMNTLLTAVVIWFILRFVYGINDKEGASATAMFVANILGYTVGVVNSFLFNRNWTFKSKDNWKADFVKFLLVFAFCYLIQLVAVIGLNEWGVIPPVKVFGYLILPAYIYQFTGIAVYTVLNFLLNKYYTFKTNTITKSN